MSRLPTVIVSSVVRGSVLGESHGGLYLLDLEGGRSELKLDWNRTDIDISGRGGDRGLRGIGFQDGRIVVAANSQLLFLDRDFRCVEIFTNPYLRHCHELSMCGSRLFVTSTGYDSILMFDLAAKRFCTGFHFAIEGAGVRLRLYDPQDRVGPQPSRALHINSVKATADAVYFSGLRMRTLVKLNDRGLSSIAAIPAGTHNAQPLEGGIIYNDTEADRVCYQAQNAALCMDVPRFAQDDIVNVRCYESAVARPSFARGLCSLAPGIVAAGSSPSTVCAYALETGTRIAMHNLSMDVRNAIHGLALWPY